MLRFILSIHFVVLPFIWASGYFNNNNKILHFFSFSVVIVEITVILCEALNLFFFFAHSQCIHIVALLWHGLVVISIIRVMII